MTRFESKLSHPGATDMTSASPFHPIVQSSLVLTGFSGCAPR